MIFFKFYAVFLFVRLCCRDMQQNRIQNMALPIYGTVFAFFALINKKKRIYCVMTNKMDWIERMSPVKHIHIIQGKF